MQEPKTMHGTTAKLTQLTFYPCYLLHATYKQLTDVILSTQPWMW